MSKSKFKIKSSERKGCIYGGLKILGWSLVLYYSYDGIIDGFTGLTWVAVLLGIGILAICYVTIVNLIGKLLLGSGIAYFFFSLFFGNLPEESYDFDYEEEYVVDDEEYDDNLLVEYEVNDQGDTSELSYFVHKHLWYDNNGNQYKSTFKVKKESVDSSYDHRENLDVDYITDYDYWYDVYEEVALFDANKLSELISMFDDIRKEEKLNKKEFADMVVTSIQNIPYVLVHELTHEEADTVFGGYIAEYHKSGNPCLDDTRFGIQSPVEFMSNFKGDCDTRSILCYDILSKFGYDVAILASDEYSHAILGISGNYTGDYVKYRRTKYYTWETTNTGYDVGVLASDCRLLRYWYVALPGNLIKTTKHG